MTNRNEVTRDAAGAAGAAGAVRPDGLDAARREALQIVVDMIVPPSADGRLPGASAFDLHAYLCAEAPDALPGLALELDRLDAESQARHGQPFVAIAAAQRQALVDGLRAQDPAFMSRLALETVTCYYQQDCVMEAIGVEPRPPAPKGFQVVAGDLTLLAPVRRRGKIWRDAP